MQPKKKRKKLKRQPKKFLQCKGEVGGGWENEIEGCAVEQLRKSGKTFIRPRRERMKTTRTTTQRYFTDFAAI